MHLDLSSCSNAVLRHLTVSSPEDSPNTDGIHLERSESVSIVQTTISTGDDCISIGPGTSHVVIEDVSCGPGHGISIGSLGKKRQSFDRVSHVKVRNAFLRDTQNGLRIKTWEGGRGWAHDFVFEHITMLRVKNPILIDQYYCDHEHSGTCTPKRSCFVAIRRILVIRFLSTTWPYNTRTAKLAAFAKTLTDHLRDTYCHRHACYLKASTNNPIGTETGVDTPEKSTIC
ncbi:polygalacturonase [Selaginella moellendorffii]|uniref:polygalacturonase n=1 Tax=Selaginella moellendorffii TaxID=88036 RepID=UPI000D1C8044|nr:polygalacturonase [Selaginella moellendorffii]|eukprot:XP_024545263.1 polygalacturonase [Selaginella moellendorffii]